MGTTRKTKLTATSLKNVLWETLLEVKEGTAKVDQANSVASQAREICRVTKLQLDAMKLTGKPTKTEVKKVML